MQPNAYPSQVRSKLAKLAQDSEYLADKLKRHKAAIADARTRLSGGFAKDAEYNDLLATLRQMVKEEPELEAKAEWAERVVESAEAWLSSLGDQVALQPVPSPPTNGADLDDVCERIRAANAEIETLRRVPIPDPGLRAKIERCVRSQPRPKISGIAAGEEFAIDYYPEKPFARDCLRDPDGMIDMLMREAMRIANDPISLPGRQQRIKQLRAEVDRLLRVACALGSDNVPPCVLLGVKAVKREQGNSGVTRRARNGQAEAREQR